MSHQNLRIRSNINAAEPLWKLAPTHTPEGALASDFMMIIPGLKKCPPNTLREKLEKLEYIFSRYPTAVLFVDINIRLSLLWVSIRPVPGLTLELAALIKHYLPEALLVSDRGPATRK